MRPTQSFELAASTRRVMLGTTTLIIAISARATLLPTVSIT